MQWNRCCRRLSPPRYTQVPRGGPKESVRWIEGYERIAEMAAQLPDTRLVYVAGREAATREAVSELIDWYRALGNRNVVRRAQERLPRRGAATGLDSAA